jgi:hypothetical protein
VSCLEYFLFFPWSPLLTISVALSISKDKLYKRIKAEGFESLIPCDRCVRLDRTCFRLSSSVRYSSYISASSRMKCTIPESTFSDAEWRRLVKFQNKLEEEEEEALAKLLRLRK